MNHKSEIKTVKDEVLGIIGVAVDIEMEDGRTLVQSVVAENQAWYGICVFERIGGYVHLGQVNSTIRGLNKDGVA